MQALGFHVFLKEILLCTNCDLTVVVMWIVHIALYTMYYCHTLLNNWNVFACMSDLVPRHFAPVLMRFTADNIPLQTVFCSHSVFSYSVNFAHLIGCYWTSTKNMTGQVSCVVLPVLTSCQGTGSFAPCDKKSKQHCVSWNSWFDLHSPKAFYYCFWKQHCHVLGSLCLLSKAACLFLGADWLS